MHCRADARRLVGYGPRDASNTVTAAVRLPPQIHKHTIGVELPTAYEIEIFQPASKNCYFRPAFKSPLLIQHIEIISYSICFHTGTSFVDLFRDGGHSKVFFPPFHEVKFLSSSGINRKTNPFSEQEASHD
jgi:hypothetical protein